VSLGQGAPWGRRDLVTVAVLNLIGLGLIVGGWLWASDRTLVADQFPAANLTVIGLVVAGAGNVSWLLSGRRAVGRAKLTLFGAEGGQR
jgi:hypothetical protein